MKPLYINGKKQMQRLAGWCAILSSPLYIACLVLGYVGVNFNLAAFKATSLSFQAITGKGYIARWSMIFDLFGCYLLLIPLTLFLWNWLKSKNSSLVGLFSLCGLGYCLFGAMGASILAAVIPSQLDAYAQVKGMTSQINEAVLTTFIHAIYHGVWGLLDTMLAGVWWIGMGVYLREERRILGLYTIILGFFYLISGVCRIIGAETIAMVGLLVYFVLAPIWAALLGIDLLRKPIIFSNSCQ